jgi:hypothetical protein
MKKYLFLFLLHVSHPLFLLWLLHQLHAPLEAIPATLLPAACVHILSGICLFMDPYFHSPRRKQEAINFLFVYSIMLHITAFVVDLFLLFTALFILSFY